MQCQGCWRPLVALPSHLGLSGFSLSSPGPRPGLLGLGVGGGVGGRVPAESQVPVLPPSGGGLARDRVHGRCHLCSGRTGASAAVGSGVCSSLSQCFQASGESPDPQLDGCLCIVALCPTHLPHRPLGSLFFAHAVPSARNASAPPANSCAPLKTQFRYTFLNSSLTEAGVSCSLSEIPKHFLFPSGLASVWRCRSFCLFVGL